MGTRHILFALLCSLAAGSLSAAQIQVPQASVSMAAPAVANSSPRAAGWTGLVFDEKKGQVRIADVEKGSPAARAGLREKQFIVSIGGNAVTGELDAYTALFGYAGTPVELVVEKDGARRTVTVVREPWRPRED